MKEKSEHIPVMPKEVINFLKPKKNGIYLDATLGGGGHTALILRSLEKKGKIIAIDQDIEAIERARKKLAEYKNKIYYIRSNFRELDIILKRLKIKKIDGILFDLGFSTYQLEDKKRGFSFSEKEENLKSFLDMRMNTSLETTAYYIVNRYEEERLKNIFLNLGEEPYIFAKKIAKQIVLERKTKAIETVGDLLQIIKKSTPPKYRFKKAKGRYADNVFRALRMEVNQELENLTEALPKAVSSLNKEGRLVVISFHSLEDRIVKQTFREMSNKNIVKILTRKPIVATQKEIESNPKSKSAKLRAIEKL